ncbi:MAG: CrcB family protein [Lactobacillus sp.]|nr:CrcB family protein [Lactobacillus sp.]
MSDKLKNYLSVGIFAFFGGALRCYLGTLWQSSGDMVANVTGCFLLAFLTYFYLQFREGKDWLNTGLSTGFVGSFTTFSSFNLDTLKYLQAGDGKSAFLFFFGSIVLGLLFAGIGMWLGNLAGMKLAGDK